MTGHGAYTAQMQKLLKLQNGYFILYYHRQHVTHHSSICLVVHTPDSFRPLFCAFGLFGLHDSQKPVLQNVPDNAACDDGGVVLDSDKVCEVLPQDESHDPPSAP